MVISTSRCVVCCADFNQYKGLLAAIKYSNFKIISSLIIIQTCIFVKPSKQRFILSGNRNLRFEIF